jgi:hypothetical protein
MSKARFGIERSTWQAHHNKQKRIREEKRRFEYFRKTALC